MYSSNKISTIISISIIFSLISFAAAYLPTSVNTKCSTVTITDFQKIYFKDQSQFSNLREDYSPEFKVTFVSSGAKNVLIKVENGCRFTGCSDTFFNGSCHKLEAGVSAWPERYGNIASMNCTCSQNCSCENIPKLRGNECGRAFLSLGGCDSCDPTYTQMITGGLQEFPSRFSRNVKSIIMRKGCEATVYTEEGYDGEQRILQTGIHRNWNSTVDTYHCECRESTISPRKPQQRNSNWPSLTKVPPTFEEIGKLITNRSSPHPGLAAGFNSLGNGRSQSNAYILILGSSGSGKSTAINLLLNSANVSKVGDSGSTTKDIQEFRIPLTVEELGIQNAELRIIDTPGLGDTTGIETDARFFATLEEYLNGHEDLKDKIPNAVLIFHSFADNRYSGEGSSFVKMLRALNSFKNRITDKNNSNVIFVFSHLMSESNAIVRNPARKLASFKRVIETYTLFPKPIVSIVAENLPEEQELLMQDGNYKLPNGELYPRNLLNKMLQAANASGDKAGEAVFRKAFTDTEEYNLTMRSFQVVDSTNPKIPKYYSILNGISLTINNTVVSQSLSAAYRNMSFVLKRRFPTTLSTLQKDLALRDIVSKKGVPRTTIGIVKFLQSIRTNEAVLFLLENGLGVRQPVFPSNAMAGYGYNVILDQPLSASPFILDTLKDSEMSYKFPDILTSLEETPSTKEAISVLNSRNKYAQKRLKDLGLEEDVGLNDFRGLVKVGYNKQGSEEVTAVKEFRKFTLSNLNVMGQRLNPEFINSVNSLGNYDSLDQECVGRWSSFFNKYGTHFVKKVYGGGAIEIRVTKGEGPISAGAGQTFFAYLQFLENPSLNGLDAKTRLEQLNVSHSLTFIGGERPLHVPDLTKFPIEKASILLKEWIQSLNFNPVILPTYPDLAPISSTFEETNETIAAEIEWVSHMFLNGGLKYVPPAVRASEEDDPPFIGQDTTVILL